MKLDRFLTATMVMEDVLVVAGAVAGGEAWSPPLLGAIVGVAIGAGVAYIATEIVDRLYLIYSDPERLGRELAEARREREEEERRRGR